MAAILSVRGVTKKFGELVAVDDVSFEVDEGEIYGIAGPNGAGKTSLFNLITGIPYHTDAGVVTYRGEKISQLSPHKIYELGIARTFQKETAFDTLTVRENARIGAVFGTALAVEEYDSAVDQALESLDLLDDRNRLAGELSIYGKKRLMIASAIVSNPDLLMLDEPAGGLNLAELNELESLILRLSHGKMTIIIIEHVLPLLFGVSNRVMVMDFGKRLAEGAPESLARDDTVIEAYLGERGKDAFHAISD
ncbi:MAG: ABC transporter ATP-binding protein [Chloroflexota bacterium]|nr:ABC transporter ATP-binding protein [Chloroflexota bacterium]MDE2909832.1 ABC transporter ATP-binding protein [Chloroflexota bacterium]